MSSKADKTLQIAYSMLGASHSLQAGQPHSGQFQQDAHMTSSAGCATSAARRGLRDVHVQASADGASAAASGGTPPGTPAGTSGGTSDGTSIGMSTVSVNGQSDTVTCTKDAGGKVTCTKNGQPYAAPPGRECRAVTSAVFRRARFVYVSNLSFRADDCRRDT